MPSNVLYLIHNVMQNYIFLFTADFILMRFCLYQNSTEAE